ncbi:hypothetical protein Dsin_006950 [Dipteronia sinensis]|uniref:DUF4283 domain-containing protein n=1 Tax=Dipteronia sinensis TaxID=43782 RepID=A0AAE0B094_9ROSI|nr:hypothetical protein Dsin_006950 [Dipteronia sinensis]
MALCLVGKILSPDLINREAFRSLITRIWKVQEGVEIEVISNNIYAFHFHSINDRIKFLSGGPWSFDDVLIVLEEPTGKGAIKSLKFNMAEFWVQISNILMLYMTKDIGHFLGCMIGDVREVDVRSSRDCLGHTIRDSSNTVVESSGDGKDLLYRAWLKAVSSPTQAVRRDLGLHENLDVLIGKFEDPSKDYVSNMNGLAMGMTSINGPVSVMGPCITPNGPTNSDSVMGSRGEDVIQASSSMSEGIIAKKVLLYDEGIRPTGQENLVQCHLKNEGPKEGKWKWAARRAR